MTIKKRKNNYLYLLVGVVIAGLICIQLYWINKTIAVEKNAINRSLTTDFEKLAEDIEKNSYCFILYAKTYINQGEGIYLVRQKVDSNGRYISPADGGFIDTVNMFNFHEYNGDTILDNYPSIELSSFAASLDVTFNFAIEGVKNPAQYAFRRLTNENLTAKSIHDDRIKGFEHGCDDYITKPFSTQELYMRINAILRRSQQNTGNNGCNAGVYQIGKYLFDYTTMSLEIDGQVEKLSAKECELIYMLASNINILVNREVILRKVWGNDDYFSAKSMDVYVSKIRKRLKEDPSIEILNAYGIGFKMIVNAQA